MILKNLRITAGAIEIDPDTDIDVNTEYQITCPLSPTGVCKVKTDGEDIEKTYNMKLCGGIEILNTKTKEKVGVKSKLSPSQRLRLTIEGRAERRGIVDASHIEAYYERVMEDLINKLK
jgi:hypothetical protein